MSIIKNFLPYTGDRTVRKQVEELFSRKMLGAVLVGKFTGDYAAIWATRVLGTDLGYIFGIIFTIGIFIYWEKIERAKQKAQEKTEEAKDKVTKKDDEPKNFI